MFHDYYAFCFFFFFFFNDTATTEIYTLSLHDALPICSTHLFASRARWEFIMKPCKRSEEHTSELQSPYVISYAVFCLKKKTDTNNAAQQTALAREPPATASKHPP